MHVVEGISDRVIALDHGEKIAEGTFDEVATDAAGRRGVPRERGSRAEVNEGNGGTQPLLRLDGINTYYGQMHILQDVNLEVGEAELVCLLGGNASGKSTTLKTILGIVSPRSGSVILEDATSPVDSTASRVERGLAIVPENRRLFGPMTVLENLEMGAYLRPRSDRPRGLERVYSIFPLLAERREQLAGTLSGGEQQMVAMGRALMAGRSFCSWTSPRWGSRRSSSRRTSRSSRRCTTRVWRCSSSSRTPTCRSRSPIADTCCRPGAIVLEGKASELLQHEELRKAYLAAA